MSNGALWRILSEELIVGHGCRIKATMVVNWTIKCLTESWVQVFIVLANLHVKVRYPAQFAIDVALIAQLSVFGHARAFDFILVVRVHCALWIEHHLVCVLELFAKVFL